MKKSILIIPIILILCFLVIFGITRTSLITKSARQTEVYDFTFTDPQGNRMVYYICLTAYDAPLSQEKLALDTEALEAVFSPEDASLLKTLTIADHPAAYYQGTQWTYLCCTTSPQTTVVLQYDPNVLSEETACRVIQSIFSGAVPT